MKLKNKEAREILCTINNIKESIKKKTYKGYELIGKLNELPLGTKIQSCDGEIYELVENSICRTFSRKGRKQTRFLTYIILSKEFELIEENQDIDIQSIEEFEIAGCNVKFNNTFISTESLINDMVLEKINQHTRAIKQLDRQIKEEK